MAIWYLESKLKFNQRTATQYLTKTDLKLFTLPAGERGASPPESAVVIGLRIDMPRVLPPSRTPFSCRLEGNAVISMPCYRVLGSKRADDRFKQTFGVQKPYYQLVTLYNGHAQFIPL